ncbi:AraC family transcriptional regulator [uncultured Ruthenibacterium sp.]|uniref:helix-turn-helix transcriptional regulator n=1 Tax=uncultured Ruthenibacterium sp. TaxID=1905347 RepID=UPI00349F0457
MASRNQHFTSRQHMLRRSFEIYRYCDAQPGEISLHHHDFYEVYLFLGGHVCYNVESRNYHLLPGDILLIGPTELHQPRIEKDAGVYERMVLWLDKTFLESLSTDATSLTRCFDVSVPGHTNLLRLAPAVRAEFQRLLEQLALENESQRYGAEVMCRGLLLQVMVELNRMAESLPPDGAGEKDAGVVPQVLRYINEHYTDPLSLELLASKFFVSKYHLSHAFNRVVGTSVYRYIVQKRLVIAKQMLAGGVAPTDVYRHCGFGDYANFYRAFKAEYHISPKQYSGCAHNTFHGG